MFFFLFSPTETNCGPTSVSVPVRSSWWCSSEVDHQHTTTPPRPTGRPGEKESNRCRDVRQQVCVHTTSSSQLENPYLKLKKKKKYIYFSKVFYFAFCLLCAFLLKNFYFEKHFATFVLREGIIVIFPKTKFMNIIHVLSTNSSRALDWSRNQELGTFAIQELHLTLN